MNYHLCILQQVHHHYINTVNIKTPVYTFFYNFISSYSYFCLTLQAKLQQDDNTWQISHIWLHPMHPPAT